MKRVALFALLTCAAFAAKDDESSSGSRTTPPIISVVQPRGIARGMTADLTIEGLNLAKASAIYFSEPGIKGTIVSVKELPDLPEVRLGSNGTRSTVDLGPLPPRNQVTVEVEVSPQAKIGPVNFRVQTPLGTSPMSTFLVEPFYGESADKEPNDTAENAVETYLPAILSGAISKPGDVDYFKIKVRAGDELVFENSAARVGSTLQPVVAVLGEDQTVLKEYGTDGGTSTDWFAQKFEKAGTYYVRVGDFQQSGKATHTYRIKAGKFPLAISAYPLGMQQGKTATVALKGYNLAADKVQVKGEVSPGEEDTLIYRPKGKSGDSFADLMLAVGREPEVEAAGTNVGAAAAQAITVPVTINGRIGEPKGDKPVEHYFRFNARKGQKLVVEVAARRLGSELDSLVEVLDAKGQPIERAVVRPVMETFTTLRDHDSALKGIRISAWNGIAVGDYMAFGSEVIRVEALPRGPDDDMQFEGFQGQRLAYFDTTPEAHAIDKAVYKVQIHPPGSTFASNGLPLLHLYYRNDDGGPGYGKDSLLHFTAPADGQYLVRLKDVRGLGGEEYAYRLTVRPPRPDFRLSIGNRNPNVPVGGSIPLVVTALRIDEFDGPIEVTVKDLPPGFHATKGVIAAGQVSTTVLLSADADVKLERAAPLVVEGRAKAGNEELAHLANPDDRLKLISLMPKPDVMMTAITKELVLEQGATGEVKVKIERQNEFGGRVPVVVSNLPPRVRVLDVGLNGVLINENEKERAFTLEALPSAEPIEQVIYVAAQVETRSPLQTQYAAPQAILLKVKPKSGQMASVR